MYSLFVGAEVEESEDEDVVEETVDGELKLL